MAPKRKAPAAKEFKFRWNEQLTSTFLQLCLDWQKKYGVDQPFSWVDIAHQFQQKTGKPSHKDTMKNKFDYIKKLWKDWTALKHGETGLGVDASTGKIIAEPEWWDKKIQENPDYKKFRFKSVPPEREIIWDQLFGSIVATGGGCVAPIMEGYVPLAPDADVTDLNDDSGSEDEYDGLLTVDVENPDADAGMEGVRRKTAETSGASDSRGAKRSVPGKSQTEPAARRRQSAGSVIFEKQLNRVGDTSDKILALYEQDVASNAGGSSSCKKSLEEAVSVIEEMVLDGLLVEGSPMWCFCVDEMNNPDSRRLFFAIPRNTSRKSWLEWRFQKQGGR